MAPLDLPPETMHADLTAVAAAAASGDSNPEDVIEIWCGDQVSLSTLVIRSVYLTPLSDHRVCQY